MTEKVKATVENVEEIASRMLESHDAQDRAGAIVALSVASLMTSVRSSAEEFFGKPGDPPPPFIQNLVGHLIGGPPVPPPAGPDGMPPHYNPWMNELALLRHGVVFVEKTSLNNPGPPRPHLVAAFLGEDDAFAYVRARPDLGLQVLDLLDPDSEPYDPPDTN